MSVDKTLSELWYLRGNTDVISFEELQEKSSSTAFMAICTIQNLQEELEQLKRMRNMKCEICEQEKHCISIDVEWTLLDTVCEDCWEKYCEEHGSNGKKEDIK